MRFFSSLSRSRDAPRDRTAGSGCTFCFDGSTSGKTVTERSAMQMTAVYSCVRILAEAVAGLPINLYGIIYAKKPSETVRDFIAAVQKSIDVQR